MAPRRALRSRAALVAAALFASVCWLLCSVREEAQAAFLQPQPTAASTSRATPPRTGPSIRRGPLRGEVLARTAKEQENTEAWLAGNQDKQAANDADWRILAFAAAFVCLLAVGFAG
mmetsp:Transcript_110381/g.293196  ORF Transcript_110381/g.293196 Transcript_110381/m.293196 type:complete len:117 (-) Transcript_110381:119-469(-)